MDSIGAEAGAPDVRSAERMRRAAEPVVRFRFTLRNTRPCPRSVERAIRSCYPLAAMSETPITRRDFLASSATLAGAANLQTHAGTLTRSTWAARVNRSGSNSDDDEFRTARAHQNQRCCARRGIDGGEDAGRVPSAASASGSGLRLGDRGRPRAGAQPEMGADACCGSREPGTGGRGQPGRADQHGARLRAGHHGNRAWACCSA